MNTVVWLNAALDQLADIWVQVSGSPADRDAVEAATNRVNRLLRTDPAHQGESRGGNWRVMFEWPLSVTFYVDDPAGEVRVARVKLLRSRP